MSSVRPAEEESLRPEVALRLTAYEAGDLSRADADELRTWLSRSTPEAAAGRAALARLRSLRKLTAELPTPTLAPARRAALGDAVVATAVRTRRRRRLTNVAAGITALGLAATVALWWRAPGRPGDGTGVTIVTGLGDFQLVPIGERAVAFVGEQSEIVARPGQTPALQVRRGSVRLVVRKQPHEPFVVATPAADVAVLGTEFDVTVASEETDVRVVRGEVEVRNAHGQRRLWAREAARARLGEAPRVVVPVHGQVMEGSPEIEVRPATRGR
jgi:ferric-dicitrate binding protein FerR (iron transport regulator)